MRTLIALAAAVITLTSPTSAHADVIAISSDSLRTTTNTRDRVPKPRGDPLAAPSRTGWNIDVVDVLESGRCLTVEITGSLLYASFEATLSVFDITDPAHATRIGHAQLSGLCWDMARSGSYLYCMLSPTDLLEIVDVSDPTAPLVVGSMAAEGGTLDIEGDYLYHEQSDGIRILDISTPESPVVVGSYVTGGLPRELIVQNGYVYITDWPRGLRIINATIPAAPVEVALYGDNASGLDVSGDYAYVANLFDSGPGLYVVDVSDPTNPDTTGFAPGSGYRDVALEGLHAYALKLGGSVDVFDISNPTNPVLVASSGLCGFSEARMLSVSGGTLAVAGYAFTINYEGIMCVFDVSNPLSPTAVDRYESLPTIHSVDMANGYLALSLDYGGLLTVNRYQTDQRYWMPGTHRDVDGNTVVVQGDYAYVGNCDSWHQRTSGLAVVDLSDPTNPVEIAFLSVSTCVVALAVGSSHAYYAEWGKIGVVDVSDPTNPVAVGELAITRGVSDLFADEPYLYLANREDGFRVVDVSTPSAPGVVGSGFSFNGEVWGVWVSDGYAYVAGNDYDDVIGLWVLDVSDPLNPSLVATFPTASYTRGIRVRDSYLYLDHRDLFQILDVSDPTSPTEVGNINISGLHNQIAIAPPYIYAIRNVVGAAPGPLLKLQTPLVTGVPDGRASLLRLVQNYPNPFNPMTTISFELPVSGHASIEIFDVRGRLVRTLVNAMMPPGSKSVKWDGEDSHGRTVPSGVYFYRLTAGDKSLTKKMVLLR